MSIRQEVKFDLNSLVRNGEFYLIQDHVEGPKYFRSYCVSLLINHEYGGFKHPVTIGRIPPYTWDTRTINGKKNGNVIIELYQKTQKRFYKWE